MFRELRRKRQELSLELIKSGNLYVCWNYLLNIYPEKKLLN